MKNYIQIMVIIAALISLSLAMTPEQASAQVFEQWLAAYDGPASEYDKPNDMFVDEYGYIYITGFSEATSNEKDYTTLKYNPLGVLQWEARYDGPADGEDMASSLAVDSDGNVFVTGSSWGGLTDYDIATIKYDAEGVEQWVARHDGIGGEGDGASAIVIDNDGNVYVTGGSGGSFKDVDCLTIKYDGDGVELWTARYGDPSYPEGAGMIALDADGNIYVTGTSWGSGTSQDYLTIKYDADGNELWVAIFDGPGNETDHPTDMVLDSDGNVYVTGKCSEIISGADYGTIKYDTDGNLLWAAYYNGPANEGDLATALTIDEDGNVYVTGNSESNWYSFDFATVKYDASGGEQWVSRYNGPANYSDGANSLAIDAAGNIYVTGNSDGIGTNGDFATIKYNAEGVEQWIVRYNGPDNYDDYPVEITVDATGNVYVAGESWTYESSDNFVTIKYSQIDDPYFQIELTPFSAPIQIPGSGGSFEYYLFADNNVGESYTADLWIEVAPPQWSAHDLVLGPASVTLETGTSGWHRIQSVPGAAPAGRYQYVATVGLYPYLIWDCDTLEFEKLESGDDSDPDEGTDWSEPFEADEATSLQTSNYKLITISPNPFNPVTMLSYDLPEAAEINLSVYDVSGRLVAELVDGWRNAGSHEVTFDASNLASGIYLYRLDAGEFSATGKMVLMK
ncbi:SBBP repeat-containing protein [bacterium]|nr:SBBP repeat-containing protein [bacterium]MBU1881349.1 SBBP repeat-containing protein [bacterium]